MASFGAQIYFVKRFLLMQVSILGLGLIGGSLGMSLKKTAGKYKIVGYSRRPMTGYQAIEMGAIDVFEGDPELAVRDADIVIVATPIMAVKEMFTAISGSLKKGCIVSDVGSTKEQIVSWAKSILPRGIEFIGGHPMAGKEKSGIKCAEADLFRGCNYCLVPGPGASRKALLTLKELVKDSGARVVLMGAREHDRFVAAISHVPFIVSCSLFSFASRSEDWDKMKELASSGFRDSTRLASGDPTMYRDICLTNKKNIKAWLKAFKSALEVLENSLDDDDDELQRTFYKIKKARDSWLNEREEGHAAEN